VTVVVDEAIEAGAAVAAKDALARFGVTEAVLGVVPSFSHRVLRVDSPAGVAYLKDYPARNEDRVRQSVALPELLRAEGMNAPLFWRAPDGDPLVAVDERLFTMSRSLGERTLREPHSDAVRVRVPEFLAALHARLRRAAAAAGPLLDWSVMWDSFDVPTRLDAVTAYFVRSHRRWPHQFETAVRYVARLHDEVQSLHAIPTPVAPIHGDFWPGNVIPPRDAGGELGIIDFDNAFCGPILLDVAQYADLGFAVFAGATKTGVDLERATGFARAWADAAGYSRDVLADLPIVLVAARVCSILWIMESHVAAGPSRLDRLVANDVRTSRYILRNLGWWQERLVDPTADERDRSRRAVEAVSAPSGRRVS
jgi:Ser/Thr protein kinase RdoA (MazF antagonist)